MMRLYQRTHPSRAAAWATAARFLDANIGRGAGELDVELRDADGACILTIESLFDFEMVDVERAMLATT